MTIVTTDGYVDQQAALAAAKSREARAQILDAMAGQAARTAREFFGEGVENAPSDSLAWADTSTRLGQLAAAERGLVLVPADEEDAGLTADHAAWDSAETWRLLATASTTAEYETAFGPIRDKLAGMGRLDAADRVAAAAQACAAGRSAGPAGRL